MTPPVNEHLVEVTPRQQSPHSRTAMLVINPVSHSIINLWYILAAQTCNRFNSWMSDCAHVKWIIFKCRSHPIPTHARWWRQRTARSMQEIWSIDHWVDPAGLSIAQSINHKTLAEGGRWRWWWRWWIHPPPNVYARIRLKVLILLLWIYIHIQPRAMRVEAIRLVNVSHKVSFGCEIDELLTWRSCCFHSGGMGVKRQHY